jgi:hypothetical protein
MDLRIRIPKTDLTYYIQKLYRLLEVGDPNIILYIQTRISENEKFVDDCYSDGCYILNYAVELGHTSIVHAMVEITEFCAHLDTKDETERTPVEWAVYRKDPEMILFLVSSGAKWSIHDVPSILWNSIL